MNNWLASSKPTLALPLISMPFANLPLNSPFESKKSKEIPKNHLLGRGRCIICAKKRLLFKCKKCLIGKYCSDECYETHKCKQ